MRIFNGEMIIGTDGVISAMPRGNYPDKWAIRPEDLQDPATREQAAKKISAWYASQTHQELNVRADEAVETLRTNLRYGLHRLADPSVSTRMLEATGNFLINKKGYNAHQAYMEMNKILSAPAADSIKDAVAQLGIPRAEVEQFWQMAENQYYSSPQAPVHRESFIANEIQQAFGRECMDTNTQEKLAMLTKQLVRNPEDEKAYTEIKALYLQQMDSLKADPAAYIENAAKRHSRRLGIDEDSQIKRREWFDDTLRTLLEKNSRHLSPAFIKALNDMNSVIIVEPNEPFSSSQHSCGRARLLGAQHDPSSIGHAHLAEVSQIMPIMHLGKVGDVNNMRELLLEEGSHMIDYQGKFTPKERDALQGLHQNIMDTLATHSGLPATVTNLNDASKAPKKVLPPQTPISGDGLALLMRKHKDEIRTADNMAPLQRTLNHFIGPLKFTPSAAQLALSLANHIDNNMRYPNMTDSIRENTANSLGTAFDNSVPESDRKQIANGFGLQQNLDTIMQGLARPAIFKETYPPGSIRKLTMDKLRSIEILGRDRHPDISASLGRG